MKNLFVLLIIISLFTACEKDNDLIATVCTSTEVLLSEGTTDLDQACAEQTKTLYVREGSTFADADKLFQTECLSGSPDFGYYSDGTIIRLWIPQEDRFGDKIILCE